MITIVWSADTESPGFATIFTTTPFTGATTLLPEPEGVLVFLSCIWLVSFEGAAVILISVPGATWTLYFSPSSSIVYEETSPEDSCFLGEASTSSEPLFFLTLTFVSPFKNSIPLSAHAAAMNMFSSVVSKFSSFKIFSQ